MNYTVQYTDDLTPPINWKSMPVIENEFKQVYINEDISNIRQRFYRVIEQENK